MYYFVSKRKYCQICSSPVQYYFSLRVCTHFCSELEKRQLQTSSKQYEQWKIMSDLNMLHRKFSNFVSLPLFGFTFLIKLRNSGFESHGNTSIVVFFKKYMVSDINMFHGKVSDFPLFPLFGFTLVIKLRNSDFVGHWNALMFFNKKWCQIWFCPVKQCLIWFKLCC